MTFTIGQLARAAGVNVETVRYYERRGLLAKPPRRTGRQIRDYPADAVGRLGFIRRAQALGFTLAEIGELLTLRVRPGTRCADIRCKAERKKAEVEGKLRELRALRRALDDLIAACPGDAAAQACSILQAFEAPPAADPKRRWHESGARR
jgi:Hg(II)-responsive transcriptional regulator